MIIFSLILVYTPNKGMVTFKLNLDKTGPGDISQVVSVCVCVRERERERERNRDVREYMCYGVIEVKI